MKSVISWCTTGKVDVPSIDKLEWAGHPVLVRPRTLETRFSLVCPHAFSSSFSTARLPFWDLARGGVGSCSPPGQMHWSSLRGKSTGIFADMQLCNHPHIL